MGKKKGGLSGFDALFGDKEQAEFIESMVSGKKSGDAPKTLPLSSIEPNPKQARKNFEREALEELASSIMEHGIITPIIVRPMKNGSYMIIAGERRWRAARMAGLKEAPVIVRDVDEAKAAELSLIENLQREDLNPIEEAEGFLTLSDEYGLTQEEIARAVGKSRPAVANALRLLSLPDEVVAAVRGGTLTAGHAKAIAALGEEASIAAKRIIKDDLNVRQAEKLVRTMQQPKKQDFPKTDVELYLEQTERELEQTLGRRVKIVPHGKRGKITLEYYDNDDLEGLISYFLNKNL
ncbi:MAG: ParB/RepB/Spo0J family partition protein [Clostridia bacterium]|nr:ParB/RepB/Spo0J family partition protein [Clostridia bacterium]